MDCQASLVLNFWKAQTEYSFSQVGPNRGKIPLLGPNGVQARQQLILFARFVHIMLVSPQAAQLGIHFLLRKISSGAHLLEGPDKGHTTEGYKEKEKSPAPSRNQTHDLKSFILQACALPLCYNSQQFLK